MTMRTLKCHCGATAEYEDNGISVGQTRDKTGFYPVFTDASTIIWLCPDCAEKAKALALQLEAITGREDIYYPGLVRMAKRDLTK